MNIVLITPVRDEAENIRVTIKCMLAQTLLPVKWIIVDDGSRDGTGEVVKEVAEGCSFIELVVLADRGFRKPGKGVIEAFYEGYKRIGNINYDIIVKFDGDLKFPPNTLEKICRAFNDDQKLGVTGGTRYEKRRSTEGFKKVLVPNGFVGGPFKFYRRECFEDIEGLIHRAGWDGVDTIKANMKGWRTGEISSLKILHLKPTGMASGEGLKRACEKYGDVSYYMGGYACYFIMRMIGRSLHSYNPFIGYYMMKGYMNSLIRREAKQSGVFRTYLKRKQIENMVFWSKKFLRLMMLRKE